MAIRNDITIDWEVSPRKITVDSPSVECTMQDLLDTLRSLEALDVNMDNQQIINGNGKVILDDLGNATGLTIQLINATVGFEARPGPDWVECNLNGGNLSGLESDIVTVTTQVTHNNPFVNITKTSSVSATISGLTSVEGVLTTILDILEGDMIPTATKWQILQKVSKAVLVDKDASVNVDGLTELVEP